MNTILEIKKLIERYFNRGRGMSIEQEMFLKENRGILFEYYSQVSNPETDKDILGNLQVWVYGDDRQGFTPHCHLMLRDRSMEAEISIIDWGKVHSKKGEMTPKMYKAFLKWLDCESTRIGGFTNKQALFNAWDSNNPNNTLLQFISKHKIDVSDETLNAYIERQKQFKKKKHIIH